MRRLFLFVAVFLIAGRPSFSGYCIYRVKKGDTLIKIAKAKGVSLKELIRINGIKNPSLLKVGQKLLVPCSAEEIPVYCSYRVKKGESLYSISRKLGVSFYLLKRINKIKNPNLIRVGSVLKVPCEKLLDFKIAAEIKPYDEKGILGRTFRISRMVFRSPVGRYAIVFRTGSRIDIPVKAGEKISAAHYGSVIYVSYTINGLSSLVLIKHPRGFYTVYAGDGFFWQVRRGLRVAGGAVIGYATRDTVLHFEIRKGSRPVSPGKYASFGGGP